MKIKIKTNKVKVKVARPIREDIFRNRPYDEDADKPVMIGWRDLTLDQKLNIYYKFQFMVCWDCGKYADNCALIAVRMDGKDGLQGIYVCDKCLFWRRINKQQQQQNGGIPEEGTTKMKIKIGGKTMKKSSRGGNGNGKIGPSLGKNHGLSVRMTWIYGMHKGYRGSKLVHFLEKEYPGRKTDWEKDLNRRIAKYERGGYKSEIKQLPK